MFIEKFVTKEFNFGLMENAELRNYFESFKPLEQNILLLGMIYGISGFSNEECDEERTQEICKLLGISKMRYNLIVTKLAVKKVSLMKKKEKEKQKQKQKSKVKEDC